MRGAQSALFNRFILFIGVLVGLSAVFFAVFLAVLKSPSRTSSERPASVACLKVLPSDQDVARFPTQFDINMTAHDTISKALRRPRLFEHLHSEQIAIWKKSQYALIEFKLQIVAARLQDHGSGGDSRSNLSASIDGILRQINLAYISMSNVTRFYVEIGEEYSQHTLRHKGHSPTVDHDLDLLDEEPKTEDEEAALVHSNWMREAEEVRKSAGSVESIAQQLKAFARCVENPES
ncbi:MAG: hypothetical protein Q9220_007674 [cf. Caloplaca sp. 1 TL-2023]